MSDAKTPVTIDTKLGSITGLNKKGVMQFRGIRYAMPPTGDRRFLPPLAAGAWKGTYAATEFPNRCPQPAGGLGVAPSKTDEDCLFLNIVTPAVKGTARPVLFWIHGGAHTQGSANEYDGSVLATQGDVVVVTINYRLGLLGYAELSSLGAEFAGAASNGYRDQILALQWVRDNIRDYGGDPNNVTIFGESAGGASVLALLASPAADGLYHKAIAHSPVGVVNPPRDTVPALSKHLGVSGNALVQKLRELSPEELLKAQALTGVTGGTIDGTVVTRSTNAAILERGANGVPLIAGSNLEEGTLFTALMPPQMWEGMGPGLALTVTSGADPTEYLNALKKTYPQDTPKQNNERIWVDMFRHSALGAAQHATQAGPGGWLYRFDLPSTEPFNGHVLGATHAAEISFTFNSFAGGQQVLNLYDANDPVVKDLASRWSNTIIAFAKTGDPNGAGLPQWPRYGADKRQSIVLDREVRVAADVDTDQMKLWKSVGAAP